MSQPTKDIRISFWLGLVVFAAIFAVMSSRYLTGSNVLLTTDAIISGGSRIGVEAVRLFSPNWRDQLLMGLGAGGATQVPTLLKVFMPAILWNNLAYFLACLLAALVLLRYLSPFITTVSGRIIGALTGVWMGSNLTLLYAGHGFKPYVILFFALSLLAVPSVVSGLVLSGLVWGGCVGLMFAQQPDVAMFFTLFAGSYLIFRLWQAQGFMPVKWLKVLIPAAAIAFLFAAGPLLTGYKQQVKGTAQMQTENEQEKWDYVTQWSFPPEETIAFVAPGYTGWRSGEPEGPYWGRMGRSAGWEQTGQGFQNFKLENTYLGIVPIAFALFALFSCRRSKYRTEIFFWGGAALVALLLAFGKYFPLYSLFYKLPVVNNIRNPNKFLQVFQVCLAILTAYGADALFTRGEQTSADRNQKGTRLFFWIMTAGLGVLVLSALSLSVNRSDDTARFIAQGWPQASAQVIVSNQIKALWHASFMTLVVASVFALFGFSRFGKILRFRNWIAAVLVLIVAVDAVKLSRHYVKEMPRSYIEANALTDFLQQNRGNYRVALLTQGGLYNIWLTYLLPYNTIPTFNFAQMPRMPEDYQNFLTAGSKNPLNMWRFAGVKYLSGPTAFEKQLPAGQLRKVFTYDLTTAPNGFRLIPSPTGAHAVFEFINPVPRYALVRPVAVETDRQALERIADPLHPLLADQRVAGSVDVLKYRPGRVELEIQADQPCMLRAAERWDADWRAKVDGRPVEVQRIDYLCQGVALPAGTHHVVLVYSPSRLFFYMQCVGYSILLVAFAFNRSIRHEKD